jgi:predicted DNA-binding transcriptional regulator AlpA
MPKYVPNETLPASIQLLTVTDLAKALRCSTWSIWDWCGKGLLPKPIKMGVGGKRLWRASEIEKALDKLQRRTWAPPALRGAVRAQQERKAGRRTERVRLDAADLRRMWERRRPQ